jgi:hypothetical protein
MLHADRRRWTGLPVAAQSALPSLLKGAEALAHRHRSSGCPGRMDSPSAPLRERMIENLTVFVAKTGTDPVGRIKTLAHS